MKSCMVFVRINGGERNWAQYVLKEMAYLSVSIWLLTGAFCFHANSSSVSKILFNLKVGVICRRFYTLFHLGK